MKSQKNLEFWGWNRENFKKKIRSFEAGIENILRSLSLNPISRLLIKKLSVCNQLLSRLSLSIAKLGYIPVTKQVLFIPEKCGAQSIFNGLKSYPQLLKSSLSYQYFCFIWHVEREEVAALWQQEARVDKRMLWQILFFRQT